MAKSKARALAKRTSQHDARMMVRRAAVRELNVLAQHVGAAPLSPKQASKQQVQRLLKLLQRRLVDQGQLVLLHAAAARWVSHGGDVGGVLVPPQPADAAAAGVEEEDYSAAVRPVIPQHKILVTPFRLRSKAFMLTFHSASFTPETWGRFRAFARTKAQQHGADSCMSGFEDHEGYASGVGGISFPTFFLAL